MGLHEATLTGWRKTIVWYQAVNQRGGRYHLWEVPYFQHDKRVIQNRQNRSHSYFREDLLNASGITFYDFLADYPMPQARRLCNVTQNAYRWSRRWGWAGRLTPSPNESNPRGWCVRCWKVYLDKYNEIYWDSQHLYFYREYTHNEEKGLLELGQDWQATLDVA